MAFGRGDDLALAAPAELPELLIREASVERKGQGELLSTPDPSPGGALPRAGRGGPLQ